MAYENDTTMEKFVSPLSEEAEAKAIQKYEEAFMEGQSSLSTHYKEAEDSEEFVFREQWTPDDKADRNDPTGKRPCLTFNKTLRIGKRIVNDVREAHYGIKYIPVDNGADPLRAELFNACVKKIERDNRCESVRQSGFEQALFGGMGFWRIYDDWESPDSFNRKIVTKRIINRRQVLFSPACIEPDLSDSSWFIIHTMLPVSQAKAKYPGVEFRDNYGVDQFESAWTDGKEGCIISEMFCREYRKQKLIQFGSAAVMQSANVDQATKAMWQAMKPEGYPTQILWEKDLTEEQKILWEALPAAFRTRYSRDSHKEVWVWYKFAGRRCIKAQDWKGKYAPVVFCRGREFWIAGKRSWMSITSMLKDPQRLYNFYRSAQAERLTLAADAPWLLTAEHIAGYEALWKTAHTRPLRYLLYNLKSTSGDELPPPQRTPPVMGDPGLDQEVARLDREMLDISGLNLASFGEPSGERTGKAILVRQRQGELINADYPQGYIEALYREGLIYLDLIPQTYTWEQALQLVGEDNEELVAQIKEKGLQGWGNGTYDLEIEVGSVSSTAREDEKQFWTEMIQANPQIAPIVMDVLVETLGNRKARLLSRRFKALLPPQVQGITETSDHAEEVNQQIEKVKQDMQGQIQQMSQQVEEAQGEAKKATLEAEGLKADRSIKQQEINLKLEELKLKKIELMIEAHNKELDHKVDLGYLFNDLKRAEHEGRNAGSAASATNPGTVQA